jgi:DNA-binding SARP family transcriptional activator/TolB-like protein
MITLRLLGGFQAKDEGGQVVPLPERARALLAYLSLADAAVDRTVLAAFLSPDQTEQAQRKNLRQALYSVRQALGRDVIVCGEQGGLVLDRKLLSSDVGAFRDAIGASNEPSMVRAAALYCGPFLAGEPSRSSEFEDWLRVRRGEFLEEALRILLRLGRSEMDRGRFAGAIAYARRALGWDGLCEEAHRQVIACLAALGERSNALRHFDAAERLFADELGVRLPADMAEMRRVIETGKSAGSGCPAPTGPCDANGPPPADRSEIVRAAGRRRSPFRIVPAALGLMAFILAAVLAVARLEPPVARAPEPQDLPTVAVVPFESATGDKAEGTVGYGIAEDVTMMLASHPGLSVLSTSRAMRLGPGSGPEEVSTRFGVRYVLNGSVRRSGDAIKIVARLTDAQTSLQVWSEQFDGSNADGDAMRERIAERIDETLVGFAGTIANEEQRQAWAKPDQNLAEQDYVRRGEQFALKFTPEAHERARHIWQEGLTRFPDSARLRLSLAFLYRYAAETGPGDREQDLTAACGLGRQAELAPTKTRYEKWLSHWLSAKLLQWCEEDFGRSIIETERAIAMAPYDASARADLAELLANAGRIDTAVEWLREALRRDPSPPDWYYHNLAWAYYLGGRDEAALAMLQSRRNRKPTPLLAVVLLRLGQEAEARDVVTDFRRANPQSDAGRETQRPLTPHLRVRWVGDLRAIGFAPDDAPVTQADVRRPGEMERIPPGRQPDLAR